MTKSEEKYLEIIKDMAFKAAYENPIIASVLFSVAGAIVGGNIEGLAQLTAAFSASENERLLIKKQSIEN